MAFATRNAVPWAPFIYKSTTVRTEKGSTTDVVTVCMQMLNPEGKRRMFYNTYFSNGGMQLGYSIKDADHYHPRMCKIAKEELEQREKDAEEEKEYQAKRRRRRKEGARVDSDDDSE
jgi:hypothetical protein